MTLETLMLEKYKEDLKDADDIEELILDKLAVIPKLSEKDKKFLEKFRKLNHLSMNIMGLVTLQNFPNIPMITTVSKSFLICKKLELNDNKISGDLSPLTIYENIQKIELEKNELRDLKDIEPLVINMNNHFSKI